MKETKERKTRNAEEEVRQAILLGAMILNSASNVKTYVPAVKLAK